jgi:hypothetical protein
MGQEVRIVSATPTASLFAAGNGLPGMGSPIVINESADFAYYQRAGGTVAQIQGGAAGSISGAWPVGSIYISVVTTDPFTLFGFGTWAAIGEGKVLIGVATGTPAFNTVRATGGSLLVSASGTISTPTFTGDSYTPSGTNAIVQFTPSGTNAVVQFTPSGTNAAVQFTPSGTNSVVQFTPSGSNAVVQFTPSGTNATQLFVAAGTNAASVASGSVTVAWPTVPTFSGTAHQHGLPLHSSGTAHYIARNTIFGTGTAITFTEKVTVIGATGTNIVAISSALNVALSQTSTAAGIISWPATAPAAIFQNGTAAAQVFTGTTVSVTAAVFTGIQGTVSGQVFTGITGTVSGQVFTGIQGTVSGQVFTGITGTVSGQVFTGITGTVSGQVFSGVAKAPTGTISKPSFVGDPTSVVQPFITCYFWERIA